MLSVRIPHKTIGLEKMLDYRGVKLERMSGKLERMSNYRGVSDQRECQIRENGGPQRMSD